jgi:N-acetylmuramoyl-L-alanine amidase
MLVLLSLTTPLAAMAAPSGQSEQAAAAPQGDLALIAAADRLKARLAYDPLTGSGSLERSGLRVGFGLDMPWLLVDYSRLVPVEAPRLGERGPGFPASTVALLEKRFAEADAALKTHFSVAAILIDPGHGGKDPGAIGDHMIDGKKVHVVEKDLALEIGLKLYKALKARYPDRRILISREGDSYPSLEERVAMANAVPLAENEAIIYVSVHMNASFNKNARGFEVWYLNPEYRRTLVDPSKPGGPRSDIAPILNAMLEEEFTTESIMLARSITEGLQARIGSESQSRGIRAEEWFVVRNARMPSVLVEAGFVTNPEEARLLSRDDYLRRASDGIYNGIVDFVAYFESMKGNSPQ